MAFPGVSLLDSFKRANEAPLSNGGKWVIINGMAFTGQVTGEAYDGKSASPTEDGAYWGVAGYREPGIIAELTEVIAANRSIFLWACLSTPGTAEKSGYRLRVEETKAAPLEFTMTLERIDKSAATVLVSKTKITFAVGDKFAISVQEGQVIAWHKAGAGALTSVVEAADSTYIEGFVGIGRIGNAGKVRNFEAGGSHTHTLTASQPQSAVVAHSLGKTVSASQEQSASAHASTAKSLAATQGQSATVKGAKGKLLSTTQGQSASLSAALARTLTVTQPQVAMALSNRPRTLSATQSQTAVVLSSRSRTLSATQSSSATLTHKQNAGRVLTTTVTAVPSLRIDLSRTLRITTTSTATLTATITLAEPPPPPPLPISFGGVGLRGVVVRPLLDGSEG